MVVVKQYELDFHDLHVPAGDGSRQKQRKQHKRRFVYIAKQDLANFVGTGRILTLQRIADHFGVSTWTIAAKLKEYGLSYTSNRHSSKDLNIAKDELESFIQSHPHYSLWMLSRRFRTSAAIIRKKMQDYGIVRSVRKEVGKEELAAFIKDHPDYNLDQIADHFTVCNAFIRNRLSRYGIVYVSKKSSGLCASALELFIKSHPDYSLDQIASHFGVSVKPIRDRIKKYGIPYVSKMSRGWGQRGKRKVKT